MKKANSKKTTKMAKTVTKKQIKLNTAKLSKICLIIIAIMSIIFGYYLWQTSLFPSKYVLILLGGLALIISFVAWLNNKLKKKIVQIIVMLICLFLSIIEIVVFIKINETENFIKNNLGIKYETNVYAILVNASSNYQTTTDIKEKVVSVYKDMDDTETFEKKIKEKANIFIEYHTNVLELLNEVKNDKDAIVIVNMGNYDAITRIDETYEEKVRILDLIEIKTIIEEPKEEKNITNEPFLLYISGIDTRSGTLPARSLSDVNIVMAVNPLTKNILMVHIPRDTYVKVPGTTGLKDKLTHTGTIGGINLSKQTIENLLDEQIPYYIRLNFNSVVKLVDAIGGITVYSDVNYEVKSNAGQCLFKPGNNNLDGKCALAFARERKSYETGDRHRGENQEQVIEQTINKISSSNTLINNYTDILKALNGTFETNITDKEITSLVRMQLNDMAKWHIEKVNINGAGCMNYTYSYPNEKLYILEADEKTIETARKRIEEIVTTKED